MAQSNGGILVFTHILESGVGGYETLLRCGQLPRRPRRSSTRSARATVSSTVFGALCSSISMYKGSCSQQSRVSELVPVMSTSSQAPRLQDQPVLSDHLHVLAAQRLPQPHLNFQLPPSGLSSIQNLHDLSDLTLFLQPFQFQVCCANQLVASKKDPLWKISNLIPLLWITLLKPR